MYKRLKSPFNTQVEVTGDCPHLCKHCYIAWNMKGCTPVGKATMLTSVDASNIIKKLADAEVFNITVTGGEPLLNMAASLVCVESAKERNMSVNMNSSLTPLNKIKAEALKKAGLGHILTSILGPTPEVHDAITQRPNSFRLLIDRVKVAQDAGIKISANMVVSQLNIDHVRATAEVVANLGIKYFSATKAGCPGNCSDFSVFQLSHPQLTRFLNDLCWCNKNLGIEVDTLEPIPLCGLQGVDRPELFINRKCTAGITTMTVSYDGSVRPCSHIDLSYGNLLQEDFQTIWDKMKPWSKGEQIPSKCRACPLLTVCGSGCRMEAKSRTGHLNDLDPYTVEENVKAVLEYLKNTQKNTVVPPKEFLGFRTKQFRTRSESFGGVIALHGNKRVFFDEYGFKVIQQLLPDSSYDLNDPRINWNGLDPKEFVSGLFTRGVVDCI